MNVQVQTDKETGNEPRFGGGGCRRNHAQATHESQSEEMGICQVLESSRERE